MNVSFFYFVYFEKIDKWQVRLHTNYVLSRIWGTGGILAPTQLQFGSRSFLTILAHIIVFRPLSYKHLWLWCAGYQKRIAVARMVKADGSKCRSVRLLLYKPNMITTAGCRSFASGYGRVSTRRRHRHEISRQACAVLASLERWDSVRAPLTIRASYGRRPFTRWIFTRLRTL